MTTSSQDAALISAIQAYAAALGTAGPQGPTGPQGPQGPAGGGVSYGSGFGGRLTLQQAKPTPTNKNLLGATQAWYAPAAGHVDGCSGPFVPIFDGTSISQKQFTSSGNDLDAVGLSCVLPNSGILPAGSMFDFFAAMNGASPMLGVSPVWANSGVAVGARSSAGAIVLFRGVWVNANAITLTNGTTQWTVPAYQATWLGSGFAREAASIDLQFQPPAAAYGNNTMMGLSNAYNRVDQVVTNMDTTPTFSYASGTPADVNNSIYNRIGWIDCLGTGLWVAEMLMNCSPKDSGPAALTPGFGLNVDVTTVGFTNCAGQGQVLSQNASNNQSTGGLAIAKLSRPVVDPPIIGRQFLQGGVQTTTVSEWVYGEDFFQMRLALRM